MKNKGISLEVIDNISRLKQEDDFMQQFRRASFQQFMKMTMPQFGPDLANIDFSAYNYFKKEGELVTDWQQVPGNIKETFDQIGLLKAEKEYLGGIATQVESEMIYHNMLKEVADKGVIFLDTDSALKLYPDLFKQYFAKIVPSSDNKFAALNGAVWSGGSFIYIPKGVKLEKPLQAYFRINGPSFGQFERTIIIVDEGAEVTYIEGCSAPLAITDLLHASVVEIFVKKNAICRYVTIQNWSLNVINLVTKRALVEENGLMEWIDGNVGSGINMKYPCCILKGDNAKGHCISIALSKKNQIHDSGAKMIHLGKNSSSKIIAKSIVVDGVADYRGSVVIKKGATNAKAFVECDTLFLSANGTGSSYPLIENNCVSAQIEHEARVSRLSEERLFYLKSRGLDEKAATNLLVLGYLAPFSSQLPLEYAVELNQLLKDYL